MAENVTGTHSRCAESVLEKYAKNGNQLLKGVDSQCISDDWLVV